MLRLKWLLISIALVMITRHTKAQDDSTRNHLMIVPSYLAFNGIRIDYELNISKNHWMQFSPKYYFGDYETMGANYSTAYKFCSVSGFGLDIDHKVYMSHGRRLKPGTYLSYGVIADYFTLKYINTEDPAKQKLSGSFPRIGGDLIIGFDFAIPRFPMIFGPYAGIGYRYAFTNNADMKNHFTKNYYDFAYSGNLFVFGVKLGARF